MSNNNNNNDLAPPKVDMTAPPAYSRIDYNQSQTNIPLYPINENVSPSSCKLPTYEEVQMEKILNDEPIPLHHNMPPPPPIHHSMRAQPDMAFIAIENGDEISSSDELLGSDVVFVTSFFVAFIFNWIGFLMLTCFCNTIAGRYGALSGFGLSLAKWTLIVKKSTDFAHTSSNDWLWWLIMTFGFLICIRALLQYLSIKRTWRLLSSSAQQRLLFFY